MLNSPAKETTWLSPKDVICQPPCLYPCRAVYLGCLPKHLHLQNLLLLQEPVQTPQSLPHCAHLHSTWPLLWRTLPFLPVWYLLRTVFYPSDSPPILPPVTTDEVSPRTRFLQELIFQNVYRSDTGCWECLRNKWQGPGVHTRMLILPPRQTSLIKRITLSRSAEPRL